MIIIVEDDKILNYLLKPRMRNDKSKYLNNLGFYEHNWEILKYEIIQIFHDNTKKILEENDYGVINEVIGNLKGSNNINKLVKTIWINLQTSNIVKFVTLFPYRS